MAIGKLGSKIKKTVSDARKKNSPSKSDDKQKADVKQKSGVKQKPTSKSGETDSGKPTGKKPATGKADRTVATVSGGVDQLEQDPKDTKSDPGASSEVTAGQSEAAKKATGGADETSEFDRLAVAGAQAPEDSEEPENLEPPEALVPGEEIPPVPDFTGVEPSNREENPLIGTQETFEVEGVEYTRTTEPGGNVRTSYEVDGVEYSSTTRENGSRSVFATENESDVNHSRTVEYDANGNLIEDKVQSSNGEIDPDTDEFHYQTRTETLTADGTRTTNEVSEVDGKARSYTSRVEDPEGNVTNARLDTPPNLNAEQFTEQLANFAENGDPALLSTAIGGIDSEQLQQVANTAFTADDGAGLYDFVQATSAASAAGGPGTTNKLAGALHDALTDESLLEGNHNNAYFALYQGFADFGAEGGDASLGVELIDRLTQTANSDGIEAVGARYALEGPGQAGGGLGVIGGVTDGLEARSRSFGDAADRVDQLNQDLGYLTLNYGAFMTEEELAAAQEEFRETHAEEYQRYEDLSSGIVSNVDNIHRLEELRSQYGENDAYNPFARVDENLNYLDDNLLTRVRQASGTQQGREELTTELKKAGKGQDTFLQDLDQMAGDDEGDAQQLEILRGNIFDTAVSQTAGATAVGDTQSADELLAGLGISDPNIPEEAISVLSELSSGAADLNDARLQRLTDVLDMMPVSSALTSRLKNAGAILGVAGLAANGVDIATGNADLTTYIDTLAGTTGLGVEVFEEALSRTFSASGVQTAGRVAGGVGVLLSAVGTVQSLADGDAANAGLNLAATIGGALTLSSSAAVTGVGAVITVAAIAGQIGLAQYRNVQASNHFESQDTENFVSHALNDSGLSSSEKDAVLHELRNADSGGRLTGVLFQQAAEQAGVEPNEFLNQIVQLGPDAVHDIVVRGHGVDPGDEGVTDLSPEEVTEFLEFVRREYGVGG